MTITVFELLKLAKGLIEDESHWCKEFLAKDACDVPVGFRDFSAVKFCAYGAVRRIAFLEGNDEMNEVILRFYSHLDKIILSYLPEYKGMGDINDRGGHDMIMKLFDRAIEEAQNKQNDLMAKAQAGLNQNNSNEWIPGTQVDVYGDGSLICTVSADGKTCN